MIVEGSGRSVEGDFRRDQGRGFSQSRGRSERGGVSLVDSAFATTNLLMPTRTIAAGFAALVASIATVSMLVLCGCGQDANAANQKQLQDQQAQLDQLKLEVAALQTQHTSYNTAPAPAGACDLSVMAVATHKGGEHMAAGDTVKALGFYQDAVTACPTNAAAQLNLANTYEAIGDRAEALQHYRIAAAANGSDADANAVGKAREALSRLGGSS
jgi:tetratricopeptide (TPR) repeat protein